MSLRDCLAAALVFTLLVTSMTGMSVVARRFAVHPEWIRKTIHVFMGLVSLSFPWVFSSILPVLLLTVASLGYFWMLQGKTCEYAGSGHSIHGVRRPSLGEFYYVLGVCTAMLCARTDSEYLLAVGILGFADAAAAVTGTFLGRRGFHPPGGYKTLEGSLAFFITALLVIGLTIAAGGQVDGDSVWMVAIGAALAATLAEALTARGMDNLAIPVVVLFILHYPEAHVIGTTLLILCTGLLLICRNDGAGRRQVPRGIRNHECCATLSGQGPLASGS